MAGNKNSANSGSFKKGNPGRIPGSRNRSTIFREYVKLIAGSENIDPKAFMLGIVGDDSVPVELRQIAARDVIPYTHKKMPQAVELDANIKLRTSFADAVADAVADDALGEVVPPSGGAIPAETPDQ